jgi:hypothetical protein
MASFETILVERERDGGEVLVTFNRPQQLNAINGGGGPRAAREAGAAPAAGDDLLAAADGPAY